MDARTREALDHWLTAEPDPVCDCGAPLDDHDDGECPAPTTECGYCLGLGEVFARVFSFDLNRDVRVWVACPCTQEG